MDGRVKRDARQAVAVLIYVVRAWLRGSQVVPSLLSLCSNSTSAAVGLVVFMLIWVCPGRCFDAFYMHRCACSQAPTPKDSGHGRSSHIGLWTTGVKRSHTRKNATPVTMINAARICIPPPLSSYKGQRLNRQRLQKSGPDGHGARATNPPSCRKPSSSVSRRRSRSTSWINGGRMASRK